MNPALKISGLSYTYHKPQHVLALENISLQIHPGEFVALLGPSGCGKSTLLRIVAGLLPLQNGKVTTNGSEDQLSQANISWMAQNPALLPWLNVVQNIRLPLRFPQNGHKPGLTPEEAIIQVGLSQYARSYPFSLSGGMQQRVALARLLVTGSALWLMDEPFAALDELTREKLATDLAFLWEKIQPAVLWVTHNIHEAIRLADRIVILSSRPGRMAADLPIQLPRPRPENCPGFYEVVELVRTHLGEHFVFDPDEGP